MKNSLAASKAEVVDGATLDQIRSAVRIVEGANALAPLIGSIPDQLDYALFRGMSDAKPQMRKEGEQFIVTVPVRATTDDSPSVWIGFVLERVPPVTALPQIISALGRFAVQLETARDAQTGDTQIRETASALALERLNGAGRLKPRAVLQVIAEAVVTSGAASAAVVAPIPPKLGRKTAKVGRVLTSDQRLMAQSDEFRILMSAHQSETRVQMRVSAQDVEEDALALATLAEQLNTDQILLDVPPHHDGGLGLVLLDPAPGVETDIDALRSTYAVAVRSRGARSMQVKRLVTQFGLAALVVCMVVWLALPAPLRVTATAVSEAGSAVTAALPIEATVQEVLVDVGDNVRAGDVLARFTSRDLEDQRADAELQVGIERLTAQAALSQNDYGAYVLSEQKIEAQERALAQIEARMEALTLRAPVDGQVIKALPRNTVGAFRQRGVEVAVIQPEAVFDVRMDVSRIDAPLLEVGQTGEVYFRGLARETYPITVTQPVSVDLNPTDGTERLLARARVDVGPASDVLVGLSGFARMDVGEATRAYVWGRFVIEFAKQKAWTYLDWRF